MSYSEDELRKLGWNELARILDMTTTQRSIVVHTKALADKGHAVAALRIKRLERNGRNFAYWLKSAREDPPSTDDPNPGMELAKARENCDDDLLQLYHLLVQNKVPPFATTAP